MTQNEKELLIEDLCSRLSFGVKISVNDNIETLEGINVPDDLAEYGSFLGSDIEEVRPYLFPMSSPTNEQRVDFPFESSLLNAFINGYISLFEDEELTVDDIIRMMYWFNKNHIDYRGLIPMGLAIDASNLNIY